MIWKSQLDIILVAGRAIVYIHYSSAENFWSKLFLSHQCRNEVSLHLLMTWFSCPQRLVQETSSTGFICRGKLNNWPVWRIFMQCHSLIPCGIISFFILFPVIFPFFLFFPVFNVAIFVTSSYLDQKLVFLFHASMPSKTYWAKCSLLSVTIVNFS